MTGKIDLPVFDFHAHGGDLERLGDLRTYINTGSSAGQVLLSLPLSGYPGCEASPPNWNPEVLEQKSRLLAFDEAGPPVYAFGSLDNRQLLPGASSSWNPVAQVAVLDEQGFDGLKLWEGKPLLSAVLGLMPDDPRLVDACREAGRRKMPVLFHVADPPELWRDEDGYPTFDDLIAAAARLCDAAADTDFIFPHFLFLAGDLDRASRFLDDTPRASFDLAPGNFFYSAFAANPDRSRRFFETWFRRILFGTDAFFFPDDPSPLPSADLAENQRRRSRLLAFLGDGDRGSYWVDNPFPHNRDRIPLVPSLELAPEILEDILATNALRLLPKEPKPIGEEFPSC